MTETQRKLKEKHGTPEEFADACREAVGDLMITPAEYAEGVRKYADEWAQAGIGAIRWKDGNSKSQAKVGIFHITVRKSDGRWEVHTTGAYWRKPLEATSLDDAKAEAVRVVRHELWQATCECDVSMGLPVMQPS